MTSLRLLLLALVLPAGALCLADAREAQGEWILCYFSSWAVYRPGLGKFDVDDIDVDLCTHAIFGFAGLDNATWTIKVLDPWNENCPEDDPPGNYCAFKRFTALKQQKPSLKTIIAVGGWNEGSLQYSMMAEHPSRRATFIASCLEFMEKEGFDGLDMDWEYPGQRGGFPRDRENFVTLLKEFRAEFDRRGYLLTAALGNGNPPTIETSYDVPELAKVLDIMSIMTYDFHGAWENFTHHNTPLCRYPGDTGLFEYFNVEASIDYWLAEGAPAHKLVMGIAMYGRCFTLDDYQQHGMLAGAANPGPPGPYTRLNGTLGFNEICERISNPSDCTVVNDPHLHEPYMYCRRDNIWCGFDDAESAVLKVQFAKSRGLRGSVIWTIDTDDFRPSCGNIKSPLMNTIIDAWNDPLVSGPIDCNAPFEPTTQVTKGPSTTVAPTTTDAPMTTPPATETAAPTDTPKPDPTPTPESTPGSTPRPTPEPTPGSTHNPATDPTNPPMTTLWQDTTTPIIYYPTTPNCSDDASTDKYPHTDCNKYWWCVDGDAILWLCPPGTYYEPHSQVCMPPEMVDTTNCKEWLCEEDGKTLPAADCDKFYECEHGQPVPRLCPDGLYYNRDAERCDFPQNVDTDTCNVPA